MVVRGTTKGTTNGQRRDMIPIPVSPTSLQFRIQPSRLPLTPQPRSLVPRSPPSVNPYPHTMHNPNHFPLQAISPNRRTILNREECATEMKNITVSVSDKAYHAARLWATANCTSIGGPRGPRPFSNESCSRSAGRIGMRLCCPHHHQSRQFTERFKSRQCHLFVRKLKYLDVG